MSLNRTFLTSTAIALSLLATTASAELTAAQVWGDWRGYLEGMGYAVSAAQEEADGTLVVRDIEVQTAKGPNTRSMVMRLGGLEFAEQPDGSVNVLMPARMPLVVEIAPDDLAPAIEVTIDYLQSGHQMSVRGDADAMTYDYSADTFGLVLASLVMDGAMMNEDTARFSLNGSALTSQTSVAVGETRTYAQSLQTGDLVYDVMFKAPDAVEAMSLKTTLGAMSFTGTSAVPAGQAPMTSEMGALVAAGFAFDGTFDNQGSETQIELTSAEGTTKIKTGAAQSTLGVALDQSGLRYSVLSKQVQIGGQLAGLPFPLFAEMARSGLEFQSPVAQSDVAQDFKLAFDITDLELSDIIWALFDPSAQLPRDPATIALDLSGKARMMLDPFDADAIQQSALTGTPSGALDALRLERLLVEVAGAKLEAAGDLAFDNTDTTTLPGFPKPVGDVIVNLAGANGLMDKLVAMGLLPAEQVMGARMMMGLFAVPGNAPDTLTSKIEFNEAGQILANGQRIK